jgi:hypothetical protein
MSAQRICSNACTTILLPACIFETKTGREFQRALLRKNENVLPPAFLKPKQAANFNVLFSEKTRTCSLEARIHARAAYADELSQGNVVERSIHVFCCNQVGS